MKILVDSSNANYNWGDASMLHVTVGRLQHLFPEASILLIGSHSSNVANSFSDSVFALPPKQRQIWLRHRSFAGVAAERMPRLVDYIVYRWPALADMLVRAKLTLQNGDVEAWEAFQHHFDTADLLVVAGGGFITDLFDVGEEVLNVIQLARRHDVPVAMFGQGIGPITGNRLFTKASRTLSSVSSIAVREKRTSPALLHKLGVPKNQIKITGDDSVELAFRNRQPGIGKGIGINVRAAYYSGVGAPSVEEIGRHVGETARSLQAPLYRIPIAFDGYGSDVETLDKLLAAAGVPPVESPSIESPLDLIHQVGQCRVVVTGSYHGGVFALSQGIPVVALSNSNYYDNKFHGLADMFGVGCVVLRIDDDNLGNRLSSSIQEFWEIAPEIRPDLLTSARKQVAQAEAAYAWLPKLLESH